jgi:tetratricopeptide (TPR) repeat protein
LTARARPTTSADLDRLLQDARARLIADPREALELAQQAVDAADASRDLEVRAAARQVRGDARRFVGEHASALADYTKAADLFRRVRRSADAARADASAVDSLRSLGRAPDALRRAARARRVFRRLGDDLRSAVLDEIVGLVYMQQNNYARALRQFDRARPVVAATGRPIDLAALNNNAATTLTNLDRLREAETLYAAARTIYAEHGTDAALARVDVNLGYLAFRQGRYGAAVDLLRRAGDVFDSLRNVRMAIGTRLDLVDTYLALNLLDEAGALAEDQLSLTQQMGIDRDHARALFYVSTHRARVGCVDEALEHLAAAEAEFATQANQLWRTRCALGRAALLVGNGDPGALKAAIVLCRRAVRAFAKLGHPSRQAVAGAMLAQAQLKAGRPRAAEESARSALSLAQGVAVPWLLFECHYTLGRILRATGQAERAYLAYCEAADALERVRSELQPEELRISLVSDKTDLYQELVELSLHRSDAAEALRHAERAKSRTFAERLAATLDPTRQGIDVELVGTADASVLERMRELRNELAWLYARLGDEVDTATLQRFRQQVASREAELVRLRRRLQPAGRSQAAALGIVESSSGAAISLEALRSRLPAGSVVLEYFQAGNELILFAFDSRQLSTHRLGEMSEVIDLVERFRYQVSKFALGEEYVRAHAGRLEAGTNALFLRLYERLIEPCADSLVDARHLVIVPHGALHYLPFHALLDPTETPLIERVELTYAPSSAVFAACLERPAIVHKPGAGLVVGVSDPSLPNIAREVDEVARVLGNVKCLVGNAATEQAFRVHAPQAEVIHLASHGVFRNDNPLFSSIKLADGWLSLHDLSSMRLRASLVTLSACETGVNGVLAGDELVGLARGFFLAGAATVVVSLWAVNDASTAQLMERFYSHIQSGTHPGAALRLSQIELRRQYPHPYHWAPFVVIGRP